MEVREPSTQMWWEGAVDALRHARHPVTPQRVAILKYRAGNDRHPSAADVSSALDGASRSTVYKTLSLLVRMGLCDAVPSPSGELRYDPRVDEHDHAYCNVCGVLFDVPAASHLEVDTPAGFQSHRARVVVEGRCADCA